MLRQKQINSTIKFGKHAVAGIAIAASALSALPVYALVSTDSISDDDTTTLNEVVVNAGANGRRKLKGSFNTEIITSAELKKAACCNLGESFTTNPSVDVSYNDAATGARQIKLLGLGGQYVQMLTENIPNFRGSATAFGLSYMPGPWMSSIQVSKGASSVKNGFESITGQINIEMLKPQADQSLAINAYANQMGKGEVNASGNLHFGDRWSGGLLLHGENTFATHDDNGDTFVDGPKVRQFSGLNRWIYMGDRYVMQAAVKVLDEKRESGQIGHHASQIEFPYTIDIDTKRVEAFTKNAYIFDKENDGNVALIASYNWHEQDTRYGMKWYNTCQKNLYLSLMFERKWHEMHALSAGLSFNGDWSHNDMQLNYFDWTKYMDWNIHRVDVDSPDQLMIFHFNDREEAKGAYAQYTLTYSDKVTAMAGIRYDHTNYWGSKITPRVHLRWNPTEKLSIHGSAGRGHRTSHIYSDFTWMLASSRLYYIPEHWGEEDAWNYGGGLSGKFNIGSVPFEWSGEYYYTDFRKQVLIDLDTDPHIAKVITHGGKSYSHSSLLELTMNPIQSLSMTFAGKYDDVRVDYGNGMVEKPLSSKWKGLFTLSWAPMMGLWHVDTSFAYYGGGRMPKPYQTVSGEMSWAPRYKGFPQWNLQVTRDFRHWSVYIGGENLTGYRQKMPVIGAANPWGPDFDATMVYGPLEGRMLYIGFRYNLTKF